MIATKNKAAPSTVGVAAAFAAVYLIWGSTYLAIRYAVETMPPLTMAAVRFLIAGSVLYAFVRLRGVPSPARVHWRSAAIIGTLLLLGGNGGVCIAQQTVPSSVAAVLIVSVPFWMVLVEWLRPGGTRPTVSVATGVLVGIAGVVLLFWNDQLAEGQMFDRRGAFILICGSLCWSVGSVWSRSIGLPSSPLMATAMEMLCGGAALLVAGLAMGETERITFATISTRSVLSLMYLIVFGSLIAFSSYVWLLKVSTPARVATYAFVNPVVAVFLGVTLGGEPFGLKTLIASAIILTGVILITLKPRRALAIKKCEAKTVRAPVETRLSFAEVQHACDSRA